MVFPALRRALAGGGRDHAVRSQLVQPRRRREGDGFRNARPGAGIPATRRRSSRSSWSTTASCCSSTGCAATRPCRRNGSPNGSTTRSSAGSCRRSTSGRASTTTTTPQAREAMLARPIPTMRRGRWSISTTRAAALTPLLRNLLDRPARHPFAAGRIPMAATGARAAEGALRCSLRPIANDEIRTTSRFLPSNETWRSLRRRRHSQGGNK